MSTEARPAIFLTRHGESEHNLHSEVFMGRSPQSRLTAQGRRQAHRLGCRLAQQAAIDHIVASSLPRTMETAALIAQQIGCAPPSGEDAFWELDKGRWEGRMPKPLPPRQAHAVAARPFTYRYGGGESYRDVWQRVSPAFDAWSQSLAGKQNLFVLHGDVLRALFYHIFRFPRGKIGDFHTDPCTITELRPVAGGYALVRFNDAAHL